MRDPLPSKFENPAFDRIRRSLDASDTRWQFTPESLDHLSPAIRRVQLQNGLLPEYGANFNPLLRRIVRRTRAYGFGSYVFRDDAISFVSFYPNAMYRPGLLPNIYYSCAQRAQAMSERLANSE